MRLPQILQTLTEEPLLITPSAHASLLKLFEDHRTLSAEQFKAQREGVDICGDAVDVPQMEVINGVAHIPIGGPLGRGLGKFEKGAGAVDYDDLADELDQAQDDDQVQAILFDIDSPGGMFSGLPEFADRVLACDKPLYAFTSGLMCSAAYYVGCACDAVFATKSADIGSIGVYAPFADTSEAWRARGVKVEVFASGRYKGAGVPGTSLSADHRNMLQARVIEMAQMFYAHVLSCRPDVSEDEMQGQAFKAQSAADKGLIDEVVSGKDEVLSFIESAI